jgi:Neuraminidase (sialidase)
VRIHLPQPAAKQQQSDNRRSLGVGNIKETAGMVFCGTITAARDRGWLTTMYGNFDGDKFYRTIVVKSDPSGKDWTYLSTIASDATAGGISDPIEAKTYEGPCEPRMIRLGDGRLFAVMRLGGHNLMCKAWSDDDGKTWSKPVSIGFRGVKPALTAMQSGIIACATGRPDSIALQFSADGGNTWTDRTELTRGYAVDNNGKTQATQKSTCYTGIVEVEPGKLLVVYDHLPFVDGWGINPDSEPTAVNTIYGTFVRVGR